MQYWSVLPASATFETREQRLRRYLIVGELHLLTSIPYATHLEFRISASLGQEPEVELALV